MAQATAGERGRGNIPRTAVVEGSDDATMSFSGWEPKKLWLSPPDGGRSTECAFAEGFDSRADGRSLVAADLDGDGDLDLVMRNRAAPKLQLFENEGPSGRAVEVELAPDGGSPFGEGARVFESGRAFPVVLARGYASSVDPVVHVGLGQRLTASLEVRWRSGAVERVEVPAGQRVRVTEGQGVTATRPFVEKPAEAAPPFPSSLAALGLTPTGDITVVQLFLKGCAPCAAEVPALRAVEKRVQLVSLGLHEGVALADAAASLGITWAVSALPTATAEALSTSGSLPLPILLVYRKGTLVRVLPGPRALEAVLAEP
ncbi:MAG: ASPIC/UnbV domain-containing protein [Myxococcaceae bacterium]|nr:ASPIC/UnbV domain-containing protein [Myxococcaceae bacterium]